MLLDFDDIQDISDEETEVNTKGKAKVGDEDLSKPLKEVLKCPFMRRIVEFSSPGHRMPANAKIYDETGDPEDHVGRFVGIGNQGEWHMPVWCRMFQQTLDGKARAWLDKFKPGNIDNWGDLQEKFLTGLGCSRLATKTQRKSQKSFKGQMKPFPTSRKGDSHKCSELAKRFPDSIPKTVDEMLKRVDDYLRSEEAFRNTELPKEEFKRKEAPVQWSDQNQRFPYGNKRQNRNINLLLERKSVIPPQDLSKEALVVEAKVEGYLVRRIHIDEGASIKIMFEHCFNMLHPSIRSRLVKTQTTVSGFSKEQVKPLGKIELVVCFGGSGLCWRAITKFTIVPAPSPYNVILGHPGLKQLRAISSTIHGMLKFPTPWGIATLVSQTPIVFKCKREGNKQAIERPEEVEPQEVESPTEHVLVNLAYPEHLVVIGKNLSPEGSTQLKNLVKRTRISSYGNPRI
ncbi:reverse transcriptase domain-containing protein [Tanacetum coccineum]